MKNLKMPLWGYFLKAVLQLFRLELGYVYKEKVGESHLCVFHHNKSSRNQDVFFLFPDWPSKFTTPNESEVPLASSSMVTKIKLDVLWEGLGLYTPTFPLTFLGWLPATCKASFRAVWYSLVKRALVAKGMSLYEVNPDVNDLFLPVVWGVGVSWTSDNPALNAADVCFLYSLHCAGVIGARENALIRVFVLDNWMQSMLSVTLAIPRLHSFTKH